MPAGKLLKGLERILHLYQSRIFKGCNSRVLIDHCIGSTSLQRLHRIFISIKVLAFQRKEHLAALQCTGIGGHSV